MRYELQIKSTLLATATSVCKASPFGLNYDNSRSYGHLVPFEVNYLITLVSYLPCPEDPE